MGPNLEFSPVCLGFEPFRTSEATPTSTGHSGHSGEVACNFALAGALLRGDALYSVGDRRSGI
jgi:hypothetical protein